MYKKNNILVLFVCIFIFNIVAFSIEKNEKKSKNSFTFSPIIFFKPETSFAFGGAGGFFFPHKKSFPSVIMPSIIYTLKKQIIASVYSDFYLNGGKNHLTASINFSNYPGTYFGQGPLSLKESEEKYKKKEFSIFSRYLFSLGTGFKVGPQIYYSNCSIEEHELGGMIEQELDQFGKQSSIFGLGFVLQVDLRDNRFSPSNGVYHQIILDTFQNQGQKTVNFSKITFNLRKYIPTITNHVLAVQIYTVLGTGNPPFFKNPGLGGEYFLRGFFKNRFTDRNMAALQGEYRFPFLNEVRAVIFGSIGNVAFDVLDLFSYKPKISGGFGIRYPLVPSQNVVLRVDLGYAADSWGVYFGIGEAF